MIALIRVGNVFFFGASSLCFGVSSPVAIGLCFLFSWGFVSCLCLHLFLLFLFVFVYLSHTVMQQARSTGTLVVKGEVLKQWRNFLVENNKPTTDSGKYKYSFGVVANESAVSKGTHHPRFAPSS